MPMCLKDPPCGPTIHIRPNETTHCNLTIRVVHKGTTIQHLVPDLIRRTVGESNNSR
jgi:hypothetical protein